MLTMTWYKKDIYTKEDIIEFIKNFKKHKPEISGFDTETNGLHIIDHTPFLISFGFVTKDQKMGYSYTFDFEQNKRLTKTMMTVLDTLFSTSRKVVGWNVKFDMHMLTNIGYPYVFGNGITDAMIYVRLAHDALPKSAGGVPTKLKAYATKFIEGKAKSYERKIRQLQKDMKIKRNRKLKEMLSHKKVPEEYKISGKEKQWTIGIINHLLQDKIFEINDLPEDVAPIVKKWLKETPDPNNYADIDRDVVRTYAHYDLIYTLEAFVRVEPVARYRGQERTIKREEDLIYPLYRMERIGFAFNRDYAEKSRIRVKNYIKKRRRRLNELAGQALKVGQHDKIKEILYGKFGMRLPSTGQQVLDKIKISDPKAQEFIDIISELRTLEKWYSTYILRSLNEDVNGRIYTTIKQTGAVSGRVSSDFQQFPNNPIKDNEGNELFHPRRMIKVTGDGYDQMLFIDYSQIELRFQAIYTIFVSGGDMNLCRAYIPFKCKNRSGKEFDPFNDKHLARWNSGEWYLKEDPDKKWEPIDLHTETTKNIFPGKTPEDPDFKKLRKIGKMTNFACNYGASPRALAEQLKNNLALGERAHRAYNKTFPKVAEYRNYIAQVLDEYGYIENLFGRRYYNTSPHNGQNYAVQGSAADFLKDKIIKVDRYLQEHPELKTRFQMNIHDEMSFEKHKDDPEHVKNDIKEIMEEKTGIPIPILADMEITETTWDRKVDIT